MSNEKNTPLISKTAFACPHCSAYTTQYWSRVFTGSYDEDQRTPWIPSQDRVEEVKNDRDIDTEHKKEFFLWAEKMLSEKPFLEKSEAAPYHPPILHNCNISECYNCKEVTIWVHDQIVYPSFKLDMRPNTDLPLIVKQLFDEAREIVTSSPKGAAALLRLCIQHLCKELGCKGKNLDSDIAALVAKGLNPVVQKALDVVRVIGNESVHPGEIDLNDKKETAVKLFELVNLIAEQMITHPKQVQELYTGLPESKIARIEERDGSPEKGNTHED